MGTVSKLKLSRTALTQDLNAKSLTTGLAFLSDPFLTSIKRQTDLFSLKGNTYAPSSKEYMCCSKAVAVIYLTSLSHSHKRRKPQESSRGSLKKYQSWTHLS